MAVRLLRRRGSGGPRAAARAVAAMTQRHDVELRYDLVYVAVIGPGARTTSPRTCRSGHRRVRGRLRDDLVRVNQRLAVPRAPRPQDGRTRTFVFVQMGILALLAAFTADAAGDGGVASAIVYASCSRSRVGWYSSGTGRGPVPAAHRVWSGMVGSIVDRGSQRPRCRRMRAWSSGPRRRHVARRAMSCFGRTFRSSRRRSPRRTRWSSGRPVHDHRARRGRPRRRRRACREADQDALTIATGSSALFIGFGFWWIVFDVVADRRLPRPEGSAVPTDRQPLPDHALPRAAERPWSASSSTPRSAWRHPRRHGWARRGRARSR